jgi:hypothetical protein
MTSRKLLSVALLVLLLTPRVSAQYVPNQNVPDVQGVCVSNCGDPTPTPSSSRNNRWDVYIEPPPNPLPTLASEYRNLRGWFRSDIFPDAPALIDPANIWELDLALSHLRNYTEEKLRRLRSEKTTLEVQYNNLLEEMRRNGDASGQLRAEIAGLQTDIALYGVEERDVQSRLESQKSRVAQVTATLKQIEEGALAKKAALFARLDEAEKRGVVLPPSSYRALPEAPKPTYSNGVALAAASAAPVAVRPSMPQLSSPLPALVAPRATRPDVIISAPYARSGPPTEAQMREKMSDISGKMQLLGPAAAALDAAARRVFEQQRLAAASSSLVQSLSAEAEALRTDKERRAAVLNQVKRELNDTAAAYQRLRERLPVRCLEQAFWNYSYKETITVLEAKELVLKSKDLIKGSATDRYINLDVPESLEGRLPGVNVSALGRLKKVMNHALEMQKDTLDIIERVPAALVGDEESPAQLQSELNEVVRRFQLNLADDLGALPEPLKRFFQKGSKS